MRMRNKLRPVCGVCSLRIQLSAVTPETMRAMVLTLEGDHRILH